MEDKLKWDRRHIEAPIPTEPLAIVVEHAGLAPGKETLDLACGMGRHARFLASKGFNVEALDISSTAISSLQGAENISAKEVDFDTYELEKNRYDLIVCTYFLERRLFPQIIEALKDGGILIYETFVYHPDNEMEPTKRRFLLNEGELEAAFDDRLELMHLREEWTVTKRGDKMVKGSIVGKKKSGGMSMDAFWA